MESRIPKGYDFYDILIIVTIICSTFVGPLLELSNLMTAILIPGVFLYSLIKRGWKFIKVSGLFYILVVFILWSTFTSLFANNIELAFLTQRRIVIIFVYCVTLYLYIKDNTRRVKNVYLAHIMTLGMLIIYVLFFEKRQINVVVDNDLTFNANAYSYYVFTGMMSLFLLFNMYKRKLSFKVIVFFATFISTAFYIVLTSASRAGLILFLFVSILSVIITINSAIRSKLMSVINTLMIIVVLGGVTLGLLSNGLGDAYVFQRFQKLSEKQDSRELLFFDAIQVGLEHPIIGVGSGGYAEFNSVHKGLFSHSSYSESFANYGFIGLFLILGISYFTLIKSNKLRKVRGRNVLPKILIVYSLGMFIYGFFYVTYLTLEFMGLWVVVGGHIRIIENNLRVNNYKYVG